MGGGCCSSDATIENQNRPLVQNRVSGNEFEMPYLFKQKKTVIIKHKDGNQLRVELAGTSLLGTGGRAKFSHFEAMPNGNKVKLMNLHNVRYLRIHQERKEIRLDCGGNGGKMCLFKVVQQATKGTVKLESAHCYVAYCIHILTTDSFCICNVYSPRIIYSVW